MERVERLAQAGGSDSSRAGTERNAELDEYSTTAAGQGAPLLATCMSQRNKMEEGEVEV